MLFENKNSLCHLTVTLYVFPSHIPSFLSSVLFLAYHVASSHGSHTDDMLVGRHPMPVVAIVVGHDGVVFRVQDQSGDRDATDGYAGLHDSV